MMNIVIVGAGNLGSHIAYILSKERHNVILIDKDAQRLQEISSKMDIATRQGSGTDWQLLDDLLEFSPNLFIALTGNEETNLVACTIAKNLRYPRTIARIRNARYLNRSLIDFERVFDVDYLINPEILVAQEILKYILHPDSLAIENFAHGALQLRTVKIPASWEKESTPLHALGLPENIIVGLILRHLKDVPEDSQGPVSKVIFPHGRDTIQPDDEVTLIGAAEAMTTIHRHFGIPERTIKSAVIVGGSLTGMNLARLLVAQEIDVRIIDKSFEKCSVLAEKLPQCTIMHHDGTDIDYLRSEKIGSADILIACTNSDEVNILAALLGKEVGCADSHIVLSSTGFIPMITRLGLNHTISPRIIATNHILAQIFSGKVTSLISLYEDQAEIMELKVSLDSKLAGITLSELGPFLPKDFLIVMIQNRGRIIIAHGNRIMSPGDTVIVVTNPKHVPELEEIF
jgi:trk system potassium uptake protein TrkA